MLKTDKKHSKMLSKDAQEKLTEVLCRATNVIPNSFKLWQARINHLFEFDHEEAAEEAAFSEVINLIN